MQPSSIRVRSLVTIGCALIASWVAACGGKARPAAAPTPAVSPRPHLAHCVLHSGSSSSSGGSNGAPATRRCDLDAECIAHPGGATEPTDGFIGLVCEGRQCRCTTEWVGEDAPRYEEAFELDACVDDDTTHRVFFERCLAGSELAPPAAE